MYPDLKSLRYGFDELTISKLWDGEVLLIPTKPPDVMRSLSPKVPALRVWNVISPDSLLLDTSVDITLSSENVVSAPESSSPLKLITPIISLSAGLAELWCNKRFAPVSPALVDVSLRTSVPDPVTLNCVPS